MKRSTMKSTNRYRNAAPSSALRRGHLVGEGSIRAPGNDDDAPVHRGNIDKPFSAPGSHPEHALLPERDRHDRRALDAVLIAVAMLPYIMPRGAVVPVEEQTIEPRVERLVRPGEQPLHLARHRERAIRVPRIPIIRAIRLLPPRRPHRAAVHLDLVKICWMQRPKRFKTSAIGEQGLRQRAHA